MKVFAGIALVIAVLITGTATAAPEDEIKATFVRFVVAQNAHDISAVRELLLDSPNFLWITRGVPIWGRDAALKKFEAYYQGTWKLNPDVSNMKVMLLSDTTAQLFVPIMFNIGAAAQPAPDAPVLMNQTLIKTQSGWRVASILPITVPTPPASPPVVK